MELQGWAAIAADHWKKYLPTYYQSLVEKGILEETAEQAVENFKDLSAGLQEKGMHRNEAHEIALPQFIYLTPEPREEG